LHTRVRFAYPGYMARFRWHGHSLTGATPVTVIPAKAGTQARSVEVLR